jgi:hypothetical protein
MRTGWRGALVFFLAGAVLGGVVPSVVFGALYGSRPLPPIHCVPPARPSVVPRGRGYELQACVVEHGTVRRFEHGVLVHQEEYRWGVPVSAGGGAGE